MLRLATDSSGSVQKYALAPERATREWYSRPRLNQKSSTPAVEGRFLWCSDLIRAAVLQFAPERADGGTQFPSEHHVLSRGTARSASAIEGTSECESSSNATNRARRRCANGCCSSRRPAIARCNLMARQVRASAPLAADVTTAASG